MQRRRRRAGAITAVLAAAGACASLAACAHLVVSPAPPAVGRVVVLPVENRTGSDLYVDAPPLLSILEDGPAGRVTVPELLERELRRQLAERGFELLDLSPTDRVAAGEDPDGAARRLRERGVEAAALRTRLSRWDPFDPSHVIYVDVRAEASLVEVGHEQPHWRASLPAGPISGRGASSVALAYPIVVREVVARLLGDLAPRPAVVSRSGRAGERAAKSS
jgi:hypothetical protein